MINRILCLVVLLAVYTICGVTWYLITDSSSGDKLEVEVRNDIEEVLKAIRMEKKLEKPPESLCVVHEPVYTEEEYKSIFKFKTYGDCKVPTNDLIEIFDDHVQAQCETDEPRFIVDNGDPQKFGGEQKADVKWSKKSDLKPHSEFAFVKCGPKSVYAFAFIRYNQTAAARASQIQKSLTPPGSKSKPMNILLLVFDSLSKFTVRRFLPSLTSFIQNGIAQENFHPDYSAYEFSRIGTPETYTIPNMAQLLYGEHWDSLRKKLNIKKPEFNAYSQQHIDYQRKKAIWSYLSSIGYTTLFLMDTVWDFTSRFLGRDILADHVLANYWRVAWAVYGYDDFSNKQRCIGKQNSHNLTFTYVFDYFQTYKDLNKFAYVHLDTAHENTGNIQTADKDLVFFINGLFELFSKHEENFALFLLSDHGLKFQKLNFDERIHLEATSPMSYFFISKEVENELRARENLWHNSFQLVGRMDINFAMKFLGHFPYGYSNIDYFEEVKKEYNMPGVVNLFTEKIKVDRTCKELQIGDYRCVCDWYKEFKEDKFVNRLVDLVGKYSLNMADGLECRIMTSYKVIYTDRLILEPKNRGMTTLYRLNLLANNSTVVNAEFVFCYSEKVKNGYKKLEGKQYPYRELKSKDGPVVIQLKKIKIEGCDQQCIC